MTTQNPPILLKPDRYKTETLRAFNMKWPDRYDRSLFVRLWVRGWDRTVIAELPGQISAIHALDVGCASGRTLEALAKTGVRHLAGVDLAPRMVALARKRLAGSRAAVDLQVADCEEALPWDTGSFDLVTLTGVMHHFYRPLDAIQEIRRVLRSEGRVIVIDPWFPTPLRQIINRSLRVRHHDGDYHFYAPRELRRMFIREEFLRVRTRRATLHSFLLVGEKA